MKTNVGLTRIIVGFAGFITTDDAIKSDRLNVWGVTMVTDVELYKKCECQVDSISHLGS